MATTKPAADNVQTALTALRAEFNDGRQFQDNAELVGYVADLDSIIEHVRGIKKQHAKKLAVIATQKSREARKERVARALALLAEKEATEAQA